MGKENITKEICGTETVTLNNGAFDFEEGMEFAYHQAILSLKKIHGYGSETIQTLVSLIDQTFGFEMDPQNDNETIDEKRVFADGYTDQLFAQETELVDIYGRVGFDFLVNAVLYFGGLDPDETICECE